MTKEEHSKRILAAMKAEHEGHETGLSVIATTARLVTELAGLWAIVDELDPIAAIRRRAGRVRAGESQGKPADEVFARLAEALQERDKANERYADLMELVNGLGERLLTAERLQGVAEDRAAELVARLTRIHRAVTEEGAIEKIVLILAEPEP